MGSKMENKPDSIAEASHVSKSYGNSLVVDDVSFAVAPGEIFGLIGPNGAGKTTLIRILMDIIKADSGDIKIMGEAMSDGAKDKIGYLPEERGLYRKLTVFQSLTYLASLKGVSPDVAKGRAEELLGRVDMPVQGNKKVEELSRGMGQIIQFLAAIIHDPDLVILDEPFTGLDPVNTRLIKDMTLELRREGKGIILSTHMMNEVEEMCDQVLMINKGRTVLYGGLAEIKSKYRNNSIFVEFDGELSEIEGVVESKDHGSYRELFLDGKTTPQRVLEQLVGRDVRVDRFEVSTPSLNEIFIQVVKGDGE
jgi:ABC-2 type transport system ATP-binding protein